MKIFTLSLSFISVMILNSCMPIVTAPEVTGKVFTSNQQRPIEGAVIYSRKHEDSKFKVVTETNSQGVFHVPASWGVIPIPHSYYNPSRQLRVIAEGYQSDIRKVEGNPREAGKMIVLDFMLRPQ